MTKQLRILISRTDAIGDVCLTLPACQALQVAYPAASLTYLCKAYTKEVVACFEPITHILTLEELEIASTAQRNELLGNFDIVIHLFPNKAVAQWCKAANIPKRIGTAHRLFHLFTCNFRPRFTRKRSDLHEAQLNFKLLAPLGIHTIPSLDQMNRHLAFLPHETHGFSEFNKEDQIILLHPKSNGSGVEYPIEKYIELAEILAQQGYWIYFTGTDKEGALFRKQLPSHPRIKDVTGLWDLKTFISVISKSKALVACSTGPYHLAGLSGIKAIGLFAQRKPIHPGRWAALGRQAQVLTSTGFCTVCAAGKACHCIEEISLEAIIYALEK
ncbi:MAG: glycosyltransferase family 9 protein [Flavobacteriales bacterium]